LGPNDDIARFEYLKKSNKNKAPVFIWIETDDPKNWDRICKIMWDQGFRYTDITHDEIVFDLLV
jgi:threonine dehydratase